MIRVRLQSSGLKILSKIFCLKFHLHFTSNFQHPWRMLYALLLNNTCSANQLCFKFYNWDRLKLQIGPALMFGFCGMKRWGVFLLPPYGILLHRRATHSIKFIHLSRERHCESKLSCLRTQHNFPGRARARTTRYGNESNRAYRVYIRECKLLVYAMLVMSIGLSFSFFPRSPFRLLLNVHSLLLVLTVFMAMRIN